MNALSGNAPAAELLELVERLGNLIQVELRRAAGEEGLQAVHLQALAYLDRANRYSNTPQALAEYLGSTKGTVSQSLLLLYRRGLIERRPDPKDGRVVRLGLSAKGKKLLRRAAALEKAWQMAIDCQDEAAIEAAVQVLRQTLTDFQRQRGGRSFGVCRTCRHFLQEGAGGFRCGLTSESLTLQDSERLCREHAFPEQAQPTPRPRRSSGY